MSSYFTWSPPICTIASSTEWTLRRSNRCCLIDCQIISRRRTRTAFTFGSVTAARDFAMTDFIYPVNDRDPEKWGDDIEVLDYFARLRTGATAYWPLGSSFRLVEA